MNRSHAPDSESPHVKRAIVLISQYNIGPGIIPVALIPIICTFKTKTSTMLIGSDELFTFLCQTRSAPALFFLRARDANASLVLARTRDVSLSMFFYLFFLTKQVEQKTCQFFPSMIAI